MDDFRRSLRDKVEFRRRSTECLSNENAPDSARFSQILKNSSFADRLQSSSNLMRWQLLVSSHQKRLKRPLNPYALQLFSLEKN